MKGLAFGLGDGYGCTLLPSSIMSIHGSSSSSYTLSHSSYGQLHEFSNTDHFEEVLVKTLAGNFEAISHALCLGDLLSSHGHTSSCSKTSPWIEGWHGPCFRTGTYEAANFLLRGGMTDQRKMAKCVFPKICRVTLTVQHSCNNLDSRCVKFYLVFGIVVSAPY